MNYNARTEHYMALADAIAALLRKLRVRNV